MNICINYAQGDKVLVDQLALEISRVLYCCITVFEMSEVTSLREYLTSNPVGNDALVIILSKESAASKWCQTGLSAGQIHAVEDHGTAVFNILIEDCKLPEFAQGAPVEDLRNCAFDDLGSLARKVVWLSACNKKMINQNNQELVSSNTTIDCQNNTVGQMYESDQRVRTLAEFRTRVDAWMCAINEVKAKDGLLTMQASANN